MIIPKFLSQAMIKVWILTILLQTFCLPLANALTSGPSQPEMTSMSPVGSSDMVDLFTGDFNYNIPLLEVDGYPLTLAYRSDIAAEEEASWVGLGWTLNPGSISRQVRGLPDDFNGDEVNRELNIKPDITVGLGVGPGLEVLGLDLGAFAASPYGSIYYNNYRGFGSSIALSPSLQIGKFLDIGFNLSGDSQQGSTFGLTGSMDVKNYTASLGAEVNSRSGLSRLTLSSTYPLSLNGKRFPLTTTVGTISNGFSYAPQGEIPMLNTSVRFSGTTGGSFFIAHPNISVDGYATFQSLSSNRISSPAFGTLYAENGENIATALTDYNREKYGVYQQSLPNLPAVVATYDYFNASAAGVSTSFSINRSNVGLFTPAKRTTTDAGLTVGGEFGVGPLAGHNGFDVEGMATVRNRGKWTNSNAIDSKLKFRATQRAEEGPYLSPIGEMTKSDDDFLAQIQQDAAIHANLIASNGSAGAVSSWRVENNSTVAINDDIGRQERQKRTVSVSYLTAEEAALAGLDREMMSYPENELVCPSCPVTVAMEPVDRVDENRKAHHISEITITQPDGTRYVYGLPTYNVHQEDVTFSVDGQNSNLLLLSGNASFGQVSYTDGNENSTDNDVGRDRYYDKNYTCLRIGLPIDRYSFARLSGCYW